MTEVAEPGVAINPPSDIVLGVAMAADPQKSRAAAERLQRMGAGAEAESPSWRASVAATQDLATNGAKGESSATPVWRSPVKSARQLRSAPNAFAQLEAFVLQRFIQSMLPKHASSVYGKGTSGEIWKSMLAEKLGGELARSGQVGIARRLQAAVGAARSDAVPASATPPTSLASVLPYLSSASGSDGTKS